MHDDANRRHQCDHNKEQHSRTIPPNDCAIRAAVSCDSPDMGVIPGALFPNADRVRSVRDAIVALAPSEGTALTDDLAVAIAQLFEGDVGLLIFMRDHPGHWICLSGSTMEAGPTEIAYAVWHDRLVEAADEHHVFWATLSAMPPTHH